MPLVLCDLSASSAMTTDRTTDIYVKSCRASGPDGLGEKWTQGAVAPTLNTFDLTSAVRAVTLVVEEGVIW